MKHEIFKKISALAIGGLLAIGVGVAASRNSLIEAKAADRTSTLTFTAACNGSGTADDGTKWTVTSDGSESNFDNTKGIHYGTNSAAVTYIKLSTSGISGTISKIVVNASTASGVTATVGVTINGEIYGGDAQTLTTSAADYTFNGSASGEIAVTITKPSSAVKALYCKSVAVTYEMPKTKGTLSISALDDDKLSVGESGTFEYTLKNGSQTRLSEAIWTSSNPEIVEISDPSTGAFVANAIGEATITLVGKDADEFEYEVTYDLTVELGAPGTKYNPYDVATALEKSGEKGVYTKGIISRIDEVSTQYKNATYYISDDGERENELEIFGGKYLDGGDFTAEDQIQVGDEVVVYGNITTYNDVVEYAKDNYLVSIKSEPRLAFDKSEIEVTLNTEATVTASPSNFADGAVTYTFDEDECATLSHDGNTITVHGNALGTHTFTVTGKVGDEVQARAEITVTVVNAYPTTLRRTGYTTYTDSQTFVEGNGSLTVTYSDETTATKKLGDAGVKLLISDVEVDVNSSVAAYVGVNSAKITYTEGDKTVSSYVFNLTVNAELAITSLDDVPEYLLIDEEEAKHSAVITVNYVSLNGEPEIDVESSNPTKLIVDFDENNNVYDGDEKTGIAEFTITAGSVAGSYTVTVSLTHEERTVYKSFSVVVRGEAAIKTTGQYEKVTKTADIVSGKYLIVYEDGNVAFNGGLTTLDAVSNTIAVTIDEGVIKSNADVDASTFTIDVSAGTIKSASGKYIGQTSNSNGLSASDSTAYINTFSIDDDENAVITASGNCTLKYNSAKDQTRFRYFKSGQQSIQLYRYVEQAANAFDIIQIFVRDYMHMDDVSIKDHSDTGACRGENGYYLAAKAAWNKLVDDYDGEDNLEEIFEENFADAYERYLAWATAVGDTTPFGSKVVLAQSAFGSYATKNESINNLLIVIASISGAVILLSGVFFFITKKSKKSR